jgi:hypothetical protein
MPPACPVEAYVRRYMREPATPVQCHRLARWKVTFSATMRRAERRSECHRLARWKVTFPATMPPRRRAMGMPPAWPVEGYVSRPSDEPNDPPDRPVGFRRLRGMRFCSCEPNGPPGKPVGFCRSSPARFAVFGRGGGSGRTARRAPAGRRPAAQGNNGRSAHEHCTPGCCRSTFASDAMPQQPVPMPRMIDGFMSGRTKGNGFSKDSLRDVAFADGLVPLATLDRENRSARLSARRFPNVTLFQSLEERIRRPYRRLRHVIHSFLRVCRNPRKQGRRSKGRRHPSLRNQPPGAPGRSA